MSDDPIFMSADDKARFRRQIRAGLIELGAPAVAADRITDVALHAAEQAFLTAWRVCRPLEGWDWTAGYGIALQLLRQAAAQMNEVVEEIAAEQGATPREIDLDLDAESAR